MKILVIDDEPLIHISIEKLIQSYSDEIEVYHAYNGKEMLSLCQTHDFLMAYVDIKLPGISGLEAIRQAKEYSPDTIYYIMTGYDSFEFAKEAIKLKVEDYLMKPLDFETIKHSILSAEKIRSSYIRERKNLFRLWLESILNNKECILERYDGYYRFSIMITTDQTDFSMDDLLKRLMPYNDYIVSTFTGNHILLLCFSENAEFLRIIQKELSGIEYHDNITIFVSSIVKSNSEAKKHIEQLLLYSSLRVLLGTEKYYTIKPMLHYETELLDFSQDCERWKCAFQTKNYNEFITYSESICSQLESCPELKKYQSHVYAYFGVVLDDSQLSVSSIDELRKFFQKYAAMFLQVSGNERLIDSIIQYIKEHCCDNLSTAMLSEQFGLSSNYITNLLKQELGIRYNDYITQLRMERAKELLLTTNLSVKNITTSCGYYSQSHFTKLFVEREGCTPVEFRKTNRPQLL